VDLTGTNSDDFLPCHHTIITFPANVCLSMARDWIRYSGATRPVSPEQGIENFVPRGFPCPCQLIEDPGQGSHLQRIVLRDGQVVLGRPRACHPDMASGRAGLLVVEAPKGLHQVRPGQIPGEAGHTATR